MSIVVDQVGIDVSKGELVISLNKEKSFCIVNTRQACEELPARLPKGCQVHLEASGGYERTARVVLEKSGIHVRVHNPLRVRRMAQAMGTSAKTDPIDAKSLSASGALLPHRLGKSLERQQLADLSRAIQSIKETISAYKRRLDSPELDRDAKMAYSGLVKVLQTRVGKLEKKLGARVQASSIARRHEIIRSVPAIGPRTAAILLCELPEDVMERTPGQICSYSALAPIDDSSGMRNGPAHLGRGNKRIKAALYMAGMCAVRTQPWAKDLYARLKAKGKVHEAAMAAVMRRLLLRVIAVVQRDSPWEDEVPKA